MMTQSSTQKMFDVMNSLNSLRGQCNTPQNLFSLKVKHSFWSVVSSTIVPGSLSVFNVLESNSTLQDCKVLPSPFPNHSSETWRC